MNDNQRLQELSQEASNLRAQYYALEERVLKISPDNQLLSVKTTVSVLQHLFKIVNDIFNAIEALLTPAEYRSAGASMTTMKQIMNRQNMPEWLQNKFTDDKLLGQWYARLINTRPKVKDWLQVADHAVLPAKIAQLRELNKVIEKLIARSEGVIALQRELDILTQRASIVSMELHAVALPWSKHARVKQGHLVFAHIATTRLKPLFKEAAKTLGIIDVLHACDNYKMGTETLRKFAVNAVFHRLSVRRLPTQARRLVRPCEKRFQMAPQAFLLGSIEYFCSQLQNAQTVLEGVEENIEE